MTASGGGQETPGRRCSLDPRSPSHFGGSLTLDLPSDFGASDSSPENEAAKAHKSRPWVGGPPDVRWGTKEVSESPGRSWGESQGSSKPGVSLGEWVFL